MDNTTRNSNQTITTPNDDNLAQSSQTPLMVTEPVTQTPNPPPIAADNANPLPKFEPVPIVSEPTQPASPAPPQTAANIPEPTVITPDADNTTASPPSNQTVDDAGAFPPVNQTAGDATILPTDVNTQEEQAALAPGFTFSSNAPVTVDQAPTSKSNAPFYFGLVALFLVVSIPLTVYLNQKVKTETEAKSKSKPATQVLSTPKPSTLKPNGL